jgi:hypothetical protein
MLNIYKGINMNQDSFMLFIAAIGVLIWLYYQFYDFYQFYDLNIKEDDKP